LVDLELLILKFIAERKFQGAIDMEDLSKKEK
jgi:hypothetical protein